MSKPVGPYTPAVRAGELVFVSGQIGLLEGVVIEGFEAQVRQSISNVAAILSDHDLKLSDVAKATVYLTDMSNYAAMNMAYLEEFGGHLPARAVVEVSALPLGALFEIETVAHAK